VKQSGVINQNNLKNYPLSIHQHSSKWFGLHTTAIKTGTIAAVLAEV
jgi:hypothetical protein